MLIVLGLMNACERKKGPGIVEVSNNAHALKRAPEECLATFQEFFRYVQKSEPSIITDTQAQNRWLSENLRKALAHNVKRFEGRTDVPDYPTNHTFVGVWDFPDTFSVIGSRHYDNRDSDNRNDHRAVIDVLYEWGADGDLDNNYPGEKSLRSFIFVNEEGVWKLDDCYTFTDEFAQAGSLSSYWWRE